MAIDRSALTPQQRLAISRRALFNQFEDEQEDDELQGLDESTRDSGLPVQRMARARKTGFLDGFPVLSIARNVADRWWRRHPANAMTQLARPVLSRYARKQPAKLIAIAAGTGALLVIVKPWRLLSVTALVAAVLKTSDVADMVTTLMHNNSTNTDLDRS